jgi:hypothetical protein
MPAKKINIAMISAKTNFFRRSGNMGLLCAGPFGCPNCMTLQELHHTMQYYGEYN